MNKEVLQTQGWSEGVEGLSKKFTFESSAQVCDFVTRVSRLAQEQKHDPVLTLEATVVTVRTITHDKGAITEKDYTLAQAIETASLLRIGYDDFAKVQIKVGKILSAEPLPKSDKLLRLSVDFGEKAPRQILSGIAKHFPDPSVLVGKQTMFVANLEPRKMLGEESNGMLFAVSNETTFSLFEVPAGILPGTQAH
jgi:methionine--tRNA ligase beta chain